MTSRSSSGGRTRLPPLALPRTPFPSPVPQIDYWGGYSMDEEEDRFNRDGLEPLSDDWWIESRSRSRAQFFLSDLALWPSYGLLTCASILLGAIIAVPSRRWTLRRSHAGSVAVRRHQWNRLRHILAPRVYARDHYRCRRCGTTRDLTVDHRVPLALGGSNNLANLQTLCRRCNTAKAASGSRIDRFLLRLHRRLTR